jgi:hypothetical protein
MSAFFEFFDSAVDKAGSWACICNDGGVNILCNLHPGCPLNTCRIPNSLGVSPARRGYSLLLQSRHRGRCRDDDLRERISGVRAESAAARQAQRLSAHRGRVGALVAFARTKKGRQPCLPVHPRSGTRSPSQVTETPTTVTDLDQAKSGPFTVNIAQAAGADIN